MTQPDSHPSVRRSSAVTERTAARRCLRGFAALAVAVSMVLPASASAQTTNSAPEFTSGDAAFHVGEKVYRAIYENSTSVAGTTANPIGGAGGGTTWSTSRKYTATLKAVAATDSDGDTITYSVAATGTSTAAAAHLTAFNAAFSLNTTTGVISVKSAASFDYETRSSFEVKYQITDGKNSSGGTDTTIDDTVTLVVNVWDVAEASTVTVTGTVQVEVELSASVSAPSSPPTVESWTWSRGSHSEGGATRISGATSATYTPTAADAGQYLYVTAFYGDGITDSNGNGAAFTSVGPVLAVVGHGIGSDTPPSTKKSNSSANQGALTAKATRSEPVEPPRPVPVTARVEGAPQSHSGSGTFGFELHFSEEISIGYVAVRDDIFEVTDGTVTRVSRIRRGSNLAWNIYVEPDSNRPVVLTLPTGRACGSTGAVCTSDGRGLSAPLTITVEGPPVTARVEGAPQSHSGSGTFGFELHFSEEISIGYVAVRDDIFEVTDGTVTRVSRIRRGSNLAWNIYVEPDSNRPVVLTLPTGRACGSTGAVCTSDGRALSAPLTITVAGPGQS